MLAWSSPICFFKTQADLDDTVEHAHKLPELCPHGIPIPENRASAPKPPKRGKNNEFAPKQHVELSNSK